MPLNLRALHTDDSPFDIKAQWDAEIEAGLNERNARRTSNSKSLLSNLYCRFLDVAQVY